MFQSVPAMAGFGMSSINAAAGAQSQLSLLVRSPLLLCPGLVCSSSLTNAPVPPLSPFPPYPSQASGVLVGFLVVALQRVIYFLPNAVLSSIIIMSVSKLVDFDGARALWKQDKSDLAVRLLCMCLPVLRVLRVCFGV